MRTPVHTVPKQATMDRLEPGRVLGKAKLREPGLHEVAVGVVVAGTCRLRVRERDLVGEVGDQVQRLQMAVELVQPGQLHVREDGDDVAHGHVVREPEFLRHGDELAAGGVAQEFVGEGAGEAEAGPTRAEPEFDLLLKKKGKLKKNHSENSQ